GVLPQCSIRITYPAGPLRFGGGWSCMWPFRVAHALPRPRGVPMIGLVIVTHGRLAVEFRAALEHVVGPQSQIEAITIGPDDNGEQCRKNIIEAVKRVDTGDGVAILTDMFGGTPSNLAISVMSR